MLHTELAESGAGDGVIMSIAGHASRAVLSRYSHVRMEAKRRALDEIATRQNTAYEKRRAEVERQNAGRTGGPTCGGPVGFSVGLLHRWSAAPLIEFRHR